MVSITINGKIITAPSGCSLSVTDGVVRVDGEIVDKMQRTPRIGVTGTVNNLSSDGSVTVDGTVNGYIHAGGSVSCDNVLGNVSAGGSVKLRE